LGFSLLPQVFTEIGCEKDRQLYFSFPEYFFNLLRSLQVFAQPEVAGRKQLLTDFPGSLIFGKIQDGNMGVFDLIGNGKSKQDHLYYRHTKQDEQGSFVAEDVVELFFYEDGKSFHGISILVDSPQSIVF